MVGKSKVPLADHTGGVAVLAEEFRESDAFAFDQGISLNAEKNPTFEVGAPAIASGEQSVAAGGAATGGGMGVGEANAVCCEFFKSRGMELGLVGIPRPRLVGAGVAHAHVVGEKDDNIGRRSCKSHVGNEGDE